MGEGGRGPGEGKPAILILTSGDAEKNHQFFAEQKIGCPVLLENDSEVAKAYQAHVTPSGYLISAERKIASELAMGAEALLALVNGTPHLQPLSHLMGEGGQGLAEGQRAKRFTDRSLARSKLKRDGLKAGSPAPEFRLPRLDGEGDLTLSELRGKRVLLVFSSPHCGPCNSLAPEMEKFHREQRRTERPLSRALSVSEGERENGNGVAVVMISKGEPKENRAKVKEHGLTFPVVLQQRWEISRRYAMFTTPIAYLIDEAGVVIKDVAVGTDAILELMAQTRKPGPEQFQDVTSS
jgi:peroxiredoxin